ncbi:MAG: TraR/DksA family transcriptional regulator [Candidatus Nomurabacteria bacterium]|nr:TraR/DksA family transcriptional regulator [Candidatus Nomurabacteria bacterium]
MEDLKEFVKFSQDELDVFEVKILEKMAINKASIIDIKSSLVNHNGTNDTYSSFIADEEGHLNGLRIEKELSLSRAEKYQGELKAALARIYTGLYGICRITGARIPKERLFANLIATTCIHAKNAEKLENNK